MDELKAVQPSENKSNDLMAFEEKKKEIALAEKKLAQLKEEALPGKCPIRFPELDGGKVNWEQAILRESYASGQGVLKALTATTDSGIAVEIFTKGLSALPGSNVARNANTAAQVLADAAPQDATEARLCMQEAVLYAQGMEYLSRAEKSELLPQSEYYIKNAMKLLRLHIETLEARNKHKRGGEQRVVVQHVQVNDGGKAIVGANLTMDGGGVK